MPVLVKPVSVPTDVIFGCAAVYTVPDTKLLATCPETLPPGKLVKLAPLPIKKLAVTALPRFALPAVMLPDAVKVLAEMTFALLILPPLPLVTTLPAVILPLATNVLALMTLTLLILPPDPLLNRLPTVVLPVAFSVPATLTPVPVTTKILALPATLVVILPFAVTNTLLFPFTIVLPALTVMPVNKLPLPVKKLAVTKLPKFALPAVILPLAVNVLALMTLALPILPPEPVVLILPAVILPLAINVFAEITLALVMLPPEPDVTKLPKLALPVAFNVPAIFTPVPVTINMFALPTALILTLPLALGIFTLLLPLLILLVDPDDTVDQVNVPEPSVDRY